MTVRTVIHYSIDHDKNDEQYVFADDDEYEYYYEEEDYEEEDYYEDEDFQRWRIRRRI